MREVAWIALALYVMAAAGPAAARCKPVERNACVLTLRGEVRASASCSAEAWKDQLAFGPPKRFADSDDDGWWETTLRIDLDPAKGCSCAVFRVHYTDEPARYSLNIGDSPTNDANGGDAGTTRYAAEVQVLHNTLEVYPVGPPLGAPAGMDKLLDLAIPPLAGRVLRIEVCDQALRFEVSGVSAGEAPLKGELKSVHEQRFISIAPTPETSGYATPDSVIYAAFNRVIHALRGEPAQNRTGSGVGKVELFLTP